MKKNLTKLFSIGFLCFSFYAFGQQKPVTGKVVDSNGFPVQDAYVYVEGSDGGVYTDSEGNYTIDAKKGDVISVEFIGLDPAKVVVADKDNYVVKLKKGGAIQLEELVATALGIERKPKELSYSVSSVKNDDLTATNSSNTASAMVGKVSGMQINVVNNGVNPNTRVVLRGNRSLLNNNQALIVVDGFPAPRGVLDRINPSDIAEVTVLKGANASALYGSEAANGVVVITTKKGRTNLSLTLNSSVELESVAYMPEVQDEFGVGGFPDGTLYPLENVNWGPRYDGRMVAASETLENGEVWKVPFTPIKDNHKSFFENAVSFRNGVTIASGNKDSNILFSIDRLDKSGVVPKDKYTRTNVRLNANKKYKNFEFGGNFSFFNSNADVVAAEAGNQGRPLYWTIINTPLHIPITQMKNWKDGKFTRNETSYYRFYENPYFLIDSSRDKTEFNEYTFIGYGKYNFADWVSAQLRVGYTNNDSSFKREIAALKYAFRLPNAYHYIDPYGAKTTSQLTRFSRLNTDFIVSIDKQLSETINLQANIGHNVRMDQDQRVSVEGKNLIIPDFYNVSTRTGELTGSEYKKQYRKVGVFGDVTIGIGKYLYLNLTARNDWSSSLSKENRSYFYPGGGFSFLASEAFPSIVSDKGISYLKLSANITKAGNDPAAYANQSIFYAPTVDGNGYAFPYGSVAGLSQASREVDPNLKPEFTTSSEVGLEFALFKNRISSNITLYQTLTTDQIIPVRVSTASGASSLMTNVGEMENLGLEVDLNATVIKNTDFKWDVGVNYSGYKSKVLSLRDGVKELSVGGYKNASIVAVVGEAYPQIKTSAWERDNQGRVIVGDDGNPIMSSKMKTMGKTTPDYVLGLNTTVKYKNFKLYVTADYRTGHVFYNTLVDALEFTGLTKHSVTSGRKPFVYPNSSYSDGKGGYIANTNRLTSSGGNAFWDKYGDVKENYVTDATVLKIREISLSYDFKHETIAKTGLEGLSLGVYARNPFTFRPKDNVYTDPEFNYSTGNTIGIGTQAQTPPTRLFGFKLTAKF